VRQLRTALAIPGVFLLSAVVTRALLTRAPASVAVGLAQPIPVATEWHAFGGLLLGTLLAACAAAGFAYLRLVDRHAASAIGSPASVALLTALAVLCAWCAPVLFSSDAYAYAAYGELARLGANPYAHRALPGGDALFDAAVVQWGNPIPACVYGPPFVWIARATVTLFAAWGTVAQLGAVRALSAGALPLAALLAYAAYPGDRRDRATAAATIGLNPAAIWCAAEGHNDALVVAIALAGYALVRRGGYAAGAAVAALAGAFKLPGILAALPAAASHRRSAAGAIAGAIAALAVSAPLFAVVATGIAPHGHYAPQASFQAVVEPLARQLVPRAAIAVTLAIAALAALPAAAAGIRLLLAGRPEGWTYGALAGWLLVPNPYPWYGVWLLAVAAAAPKTRSAAVAIGLSLASLLRYVPDAVGTPGTPAAVVLGVAATLPFALLFRPRQPRLL
jgi:hypothetical protein